MFQFIQFSFEFKVAVLACRNILGAKIKDNTVVTLYSLFSAHDLFWKKPQYIVNKHWKVSVMVKEWTSKYGKMNGEAFLIHHEKRLENALSSNNPASNFAIYRDFRKKAFPEKNPTPPLVKSLIKKEKEGVVGAFSYYHTIIGDLLISS